VLNGETNCDFEQLVSVNKHLVLRTACRVLRNLDDAQDAAQEVFLRLSMHENAIPHLRAWLYRVTVNVCNDRYRGRMHVIELPPAVTDPRPDPERTLCSKERMRLIVEGLGLLCRRERVCLVLRNLEGLRTHEVAAMLKIEETTVRTQINRARVKLARYARSRGLS
jgi:RNA polymerase sigma factor (sigma-70 family)